MIRLVVHGEPRGKSRPRFTKQGHAYNDTKTVSAEGQVQHAWDLAGKPRLEGPIAMKVEAVMSRPSGHWNKSGLSAQGKQKPWPTKVPDVDNFLKLAQDALNRLAFHDDAQIVSATCWKRWANPGETPHTAIEVWPIGDFQRTAA